jgi:uncharacterized protein (DUF983 family)
MVAHIAFILPERGRRHSKSVGDTLGQAVQEKCPECGGPYLVEKWLKAGPVLQCPNADCKHKQPMLVPVEALAQ